MADRAAGGLAALLVPDPPPFAVLHRPELGVGIEVLRGEVASVGALREVRVRPPVRGQAGHDLLVAVPYRQVAERGFACTDDAAPLLQLTVRAQDTVPVAEALSQLPDEPVTLRDAAFDTTDERYAEIVRTVLAEEIGRGAGANFVIRRTFQATVADFSARRALAIFRRLLLAEQSAYWTFVVYTGERTLVGASPERHVSLDQGTAVMNPISGTYRYPPDGASIQDVLRFLADQKETDELFMVLDEELKMMAGICGSGVRVRGPRLREMAWLAHTEYVIEGRNRLDVRDILRETLFAPTVTGSPLENACRVIQRYEPDGRGYYSGVLALVGHDRDGNQTLDSAIMIRTSEIDRRGRMRLGVGATLVRHSDPASEVAETHAKLAGLLAALDSGQTAPRRQVSRQDVAAHPLVRRALCRRNERLARFWLAESGEGRQTASRFAGRSVLVIDAEDAFTAMLSQELGALGLTVTVRRFDAVHRLGGHDLVVMGPGPGDPRALEDRKIATLHEITGRLLHGQHRFLAVCLGHQVLSGLLGLELVRRPVPNQGRQISIDLFGTRRTVGFYNSFTARSDRDRLCCPHLPGEVELCREPGTGEVHAMRGPGLRSIQFHPESVLSVDGLAVLTELVGSLLPVAAAEPAPRRASAHDPVNSAGDR